MMINSNDDVTVRIARKGTDEANAIQVAAKRSHNLL